MSDAKVVVDVEAVVKWLDDGDTWMRRGRVLFVAGYSSTPTPLATGSGETPAGDAAWKLEPATSKQLELLEKNHITIKPGVTKGEASTLIDALIKKRREGHP